MRLLSIIYVAVALTIGCKRQTGPEQVTNSAGSKPPLFQVGLVEDVPSTQSEKISFAHKAPDGTPTNETLNVWKIPGLDQTALKHGTTVWQRGDAAAISVEFDEKAKPLFADLTRTNVGRRVAIFIDGQVTSTPEIKGEVPDGKIELRGDWTLAEAQALRKRIEETALKN